MIARFHYDDETLSGLLRNDPSEDRSAVFAHVETCEQCKSQLETLTQDGLTWEEAGALLRRDSLDGLCDPAQGNLDVRPGGSLLHPSDHPDSLGRFGRYEILEILGSGGMGIVMRGYDSALNRHSAIKVLAPELASNAAARQRFSREAKSAAAVVHPHVVPIQTVDQSEGLPYLVMPVVEGQSLQQRVDRDGPLETIEAVRIAAQVAEGLAAAHAQGLVHRDIKPANILLENGVERVQITDFGLARAADDASMTRSGVIAGTPQYMSPEQAHGDTIDPRSDLFSVGSLIYFMCTGRSPFRAETTMGVLSRIAHDEPRPIRATNPDIPDWLQHIVSRLLSKAPADRHASASDVAQELNHWLAHLQTPDSVAPPTTQAASGIRLPKFPRGWVGACAAGMLAILSGLVVLETNKGTITIRNNSQLDVPIRIRRGEKTVDSITVSALGASTRVRAGEYTIEIDGNSDEFKITGNQVTLTRGGNWVVTISTEPGKETLGPMLLDPALGDLGPAHEIPIHTKPFGSRDPSQFREGLKVAQRRVDQVTESVQRWHDRVVQWEARLKGEGDGYPIANSSSIDDAKASQRQQEKLLLEVKGDQRFVERQLLSQVEMLKQDLRAAAELTKLTQKQQEQMQKVFSKGMVSEAEMMEKQVASVKADAELRQATILLDSYTAVAQEFGLYDRSLGAPPSRSKSLEIGPSKVSFLVDVNEWGVIVWKGKTRSVEELCESLANLKLYPDRSIIQFSIHPNVPYQKIKQLLEAVRRIPQLENVELSIKTQKSNPNSASASPEEPEQNPGTPNRKPSMR